MNDIEILKSKITMVDLMQKLGFQNMNKTHAQCVLHDDQKTMSFSFNEDLWHCFGCQAGGDKIQLIKDVLKTDFKGAVEYLSKETGFYPKFKMKRSKINHKENIKNFVTVLNNTDYVKLYNDDLKKKYKELDSRWCKVAIVNKDSWLADFFIEVSLECYMRYLDYFAINFK